MTCFFALKTQREPAVDGGIYEERQEIPAQRHQEGIGILRHIPWLGLESGSVNSYASRRCQQTFRWCQCSSWRQHHQDKPRDLSHADRICRKWMDYLGAGEAGDLHTYSAIDRSERRSKDKRVAYPTSAGWRGRLDGHWPRPPRNVCDCEERYPRLTFPSLNRLRHEQYVQHQCLTLKPNRGI